MGDAEALRAAADAIERRRLRLSAPGDTMPILLREVADDIAAETARPLYDQASDEGRMARVIEVSRALIDVALALRLGLLHEGWGADHPLCKHLDRTAQDWADAREAQARVMLRWRRDQGVLIGSGPDRD